MYTNEIQSRASFEQIDKFFMRIIFFCNLKHEVINDNIFYQFNCDVGKITLEQLTQKNRTFTENP